MRVVHLVWVKHKKKYVTYNEEANVLYISIDEPKKALGVDIGEGTIIRYVESKGEVVGLTLIGVKERRIKSLK